MANTQTYFIYNDDAVSTLKKQDKTLGAYIKKVGHLQRATNTDIFSALIDSIISQQISNAAAKTVYGRFCELVGDITPVAIYNTPTESIQKCGMSMRKATYIKSAAISTLLGTPRYGIVPVVEESFAPINIDDLQNLTDLEIIKALSSLRGVGKWTAQMLMIFSLNRMDVISYDDLAIRRGMKILYGMENEPTKQEFATIAKNYAPFSSVASLYLWELSH